MLLSHFQQRFPFMISNRMRQLTIKRFFKFLLPVCGLTTLAITFTSINLQHGVIRTIQAALLNHVDKLHYQGSTSKGKQFSLYSQSGVEVSKNEIAFKEVNGTLKQSKGETVELQADQGLLNKSDKSVHLLGNVILSHENGLKLRTKEATLNLETGNASGETPIEGEHEKAHIHAQKFQVKGGTEIVFLGDPELVLKAY